MKQTPSTTYFLGRRAFAALIALLLIGASFFPSARPVSAQADGLQMNVTPAFDGYFKYGEWLPIDVELSNQGGDLEGEIRIQVAGSTGVLVFEAPVTLPSGSRKRVSVYVLPNNFSRELDVRFVSKETALATAKATVRPQPNIAYFAGFIAPERGALSMLNGVKFPGQERPKILVDLALADLPERGEGLRMFDLLVLNDVDTSSMSPDQARALSAWVKQGGRLVIGGGAGAKRSLAGLPEELQPILLNSSQDIAAENLNALAGFAKSEPILLPGKFVLASGDPGESRVVVGDAATPLVLERSLGAGVVDFVALDVAGVPFNGWPGTQSFWENLIGPTGKYPDNMPFDVSPRQWRANNLSYALSNIPSLDLPSVTNVSILLVVYIIIVGPVNYFILRWRRRMHWAWITIPVLTLVFTAASFGIGYGLRGNDLILNKIALVETSSTGDASLMSFMGLFSPRMQSYEVSVLGEGLVSPVSGYSPGPWQQGNPGGGEMVLVQGEPAKVKGLTVNQWAMQSFMSEGIWEDFGTFSGKLVMRDEKITGTVRNESKYTITDVVITVQSRFARLGDLAPGQEKAVEIALGGLQSDRFGPPLSYRIYQEEMGNGPMPRILEQKSNILNSLFENGMGGKFGTSTLGTQGGRGSVTVFGWLDQAPPDVQVDNNALTQKTTALIYTSLDYSLPKDGKLAIPAGLIPGVLIQMPPNGGTCGTPTSLHMSSGEAVFEFQLPSSARDFRTDTLKVAMWNDSGNPAGSPSISVYNWDEEKWHTIQSPIMGTNLIENAGPFVNEAGQVRVSLSSQSDTFGCVYIDLGIDASAAERQGG